MHGLVYTRAEKNSLVWPCAYTRVGLLMEFYGMTT